LKSAGTEDLVICIWWNIEIKYILINLGVVFQKIGR
jgi:hypothetical protein